jgi:hypothetical protein
MISAAECREHAVECRQMSERPPNLRVRDILIDMARTWEGLALETEQRRRLPNMCCAINFEGSCRRRTPSGVGSLAVVSGGGNPQYCPWGGALFTTLARACTH